MKGPERRPLTYFFRVKNRLWKNEKSKTHMYRDIVGIITVGVGFALTSKGDAQKLKWFDHKTKKPVDRSAVDEAYATMLKQPYSSEQPTTC